MGGELAEGLEARPHPLGGVVDDAVGWQEAVSPWRGAALSCRKAWPSRFRFLMRFAVEDRLSAPCIARVGPSNCGSEFFRSCDGEGEIAICRFGDKRECAWLLRPGAR